jgi:hypothetical protein
MGSTPINWTIGTYKMQTGLMGDELDRVYQDYLNQVGGRMDEYYDPYYDEFYYAEPVQLYDPYYDEFYSADPYQAYIEGFNQDLGEMGFYEDYSLFDPAASTPFESQMITEPGIDALPVSSVNWDYWLSLGSDLPTPVDYSAQMDQFFEEALRPGGSIAEFGAELEAEYQAEMQGENINDFFASLFPEPGFEDTPELHPWVSEMFPGSPSGGYGSSIPSGGGSGSSFPISGGSGQKPPTAQQSQATASGQPSALDTILKSVASVLNKATGTTPVYSSVGTISRPGGGISAALQSDVMGLPLWAIAGGGIAAFMLLKKRK